LLQVGDLFELNVKLQCQKVKMGRRREKWPEKDGSEELEAEGAREEEMERNN
jgi:hypothetical protein